MPDIVFHYPPELFDLLVDTIPRLNRSKKGVLLFFKGAGVSDSMLADLRVIIATTPDNIDKFTITRTVLERMNAKGEATLRERREVLRRVVEFANYDSCWPNDRLKAKGLVAAIRNVVGEKDSFTRMKQERDLERQARSSMLQNAARQKKEQLQRIEDAKRAVYALFNPEMKGRVRGKKLESALNDLFDAFGIGVRKAFHLAGEHNEGIVEQVDGVVEVDAHVYLVEVTWYSAPVGKAKISQHLVRLMGRAEARGIFFSASEYTKAAVAAARECLQHKVVVLATLDEVVRVLESQDDLGGFLRKKVDGAMIDRNPYLRPYD